jgi:hypothetical protein
MEEMKKKPRGESGYFPRVAKGTTIGRCCPRGDISCLAGVAELDQITQNSAILVLMSV